MIQTLVKGTLAGAVLAALSLVATGAPAQAQRARWCAQYDWSTINCGFYTREQCLAAISGVGGDCTLGVNGPAAFGTEPGGTYSRPHRHRRHRED